MKRLFFLACLICFSASAQDNNKLGPADDPTFALDADFSPYVFQTGDFGAGRVYTHGVSFQFGFHYKKWTGYAFSSLPYFDSETFYYSQSFRQTLEPELLTRYQFMVQYNLLQDRLVQRKHPWGYFLLDVNFGSDNLLHSLGNQNEWGYDTLFNGQMRKNYQSSLGSFSIGPRLKWITPRSKGTEIVHTINILAQLAFVEKFKGFFFDEYKNKYRETNGKVGEVGRKTGFLVSYDCVRYRKGGGGIRISTFFHYYPYFISANLQLPDLTPKPPSSTSSYLFGIEVGFSIH